LKESWLKLRTVIFNTLIIFLFILLQFETLVYAEVESDVSIHINLWEKELVVFENENELLRYPIAIGTDLSPTPVGTYTITEKAKSWGGGFGSRWLGLDVPWGVYGIHGTNKPHLLGENVSSGCIRMRNEDVEEFYELVSVGTKVRIKGPITGVGEGEYKNLAVGSKGNLVELVQGRLKAMGLYDGDINGIYGVKTENAVRTFQKEHKLSVNGVISFREYLLLGLLE